MKILIVGNDPDEIGGVANYTRPLASKFVELGHEVFYFFSGAYHEKYNWFFFPYLRIKPSSFPFECAEVVNSPNLPYNFGNSELDVGSPRMETIFSNYLDRVRPDVVHIHSRLGLPFSFARIAHDRGIKVFNSVHVYGLLCQKRVMIDSTGEPCEGPSDLHKCAACVGSIDSGKYKLTSRLENTSKKLTALLVDLKRIWKRAQRTNGPGVADLRIVPSPEDIEKLNTRLRFNIETMNTCVDCNVCVSTDVKNTLMKYGVTEERLLVQHIGSAIAENRIRNYSNPHTPITIGNIGGVNYYKGTHVLVDAIDKISNNNFSVKIFGGYQDSYVNGIMKGKEDLPISFMGRYAPADLPEILRGIDIMVLPSICNDTAPQTIFESYSAGIPVIASDTGGFPDFVSNGENGYLFRRGDSNDLAEKLELLINHPHAIPKLAAKVPKLKTITENARELAARYRNCRLSEGSIPGRIHT